jgi:hypothetical protein
MGQRGADQQLGTIYKGVMMSGGKTTLSISGGSEPIYLSPGVWQLELYASSWDTGNPVAIQYATDTAERYAAIEDPSNSNEDTARIANGQPIILPTAGGFVRIYIETIGTTSGLTLEAKSIPQGGL